MITVRCAGVEAFSPSAEGALLAARTLYAEACQARVQGMLSVSFYDSDGLLVRSLDGAALAALTEGGS